MDCEICYNEFPEFNLISGGCCSLKLCKECIKDLKNCPQCKKVYFWNDKEEKKDLNLIYELYEKNFEIFRLNSTLRDSEFNYSLVTDLNKELNKKIKILDSEINKLIEQNDELNYQIKSIQIKENYNNYLEKTILKYNLNLS